MDAGSIPAYSTGKEMNEDEETIRIIGFLEESGAISWEGIDEDGEAVFQFNMDILKEVMPELYEDIVKDLDEDLLRLYQEGLVDLEYDEDLNAMFKITEKGQQFFEHLENLEE